MNPLRSLGLTNLALAGGVLAVGGWLIWGAEAPDRARAQVAALDAERVRTLSIDRVGRAGIALERRTDGWWITAPFSIPADATRVRALLEVPSKTRLATYPLSVVETHKLGLDPPLAALRYQPSGLVIGVGRAHPVDRRRYLLVGREVVLVTDTLGDLYTEDPGGFADRHPVPRGVDIRALRLPGLTVERDLHGLWTATDPAWTQERVKALVGAWTSAASLRVQRVSRRTGGDGPRVIVDLDDGRTLDFGVHLTDRELALVRQDPSLVYRFQGDAARVLLPGNGGGN